MRKKVRLFVISSYMRTLENDLENDIRVKIVGGKKRWKDNKTQRKRVSFNPDIIYIGEHYHQVDKMKSIDKEIHKEFVNDYLHHELPLIKISDFILAVFDCEFIIYDALKIFYAAAMKKNVIIFINNKLLNIEGRYSLQYLFELCSLFNNNVKVNYYDDVEEVFEYLKNIGEMPSLLSVFDYSPKRILNEVRVFVSANFNVMYRNINYVTVEKALKKDFRSKLFGSSEYLVFEKNSLGILYNKVVKYTGSFYYYYLDKNDCISNRSVVDYRFAVKQTMERIRFSDIVFVLFDRNDYVNSLSNLLYACLLKKKIFLFYDKKNLHGDICDCFYLIIRFAKFLCDDITLFNYVDNNEILEMIRNVHIYL